MKKNMKKNMKKKHEDHLTLIESHKEEYEDCLIKRFTFI